MGPAARISTGFAAVPAIEKPAMAVWSPLAVRVRDARLARRESAEFGTVRPTPVVSVTARSSMRQLAVLVPALPAPP